MFRQYIYKKLMQLIRFGESEFFAKPLRIATTLFTILLAAGFFLLATGNAMQDPLCCRDDSYFSTVAKNFANGYGYAVSFNSPTGELRLFDPTITMGPNLIIPAAFFIKVFGNTFWITGIVAICINILIFTALYLFSFRVFGLLKTNLLFSLLFISFYSFSAPKLFYLWYTLFGEVAGIGFYLLGLLLFCFLRQKQKYLYLSMFLFGLAVMTKLIYLIVFFPVLGYYYYDTLHANGFNQKNIRLFVAGMIMFALPHILWEIYKIAILGFSGYMQLIHDTINTYTKIHGDNVQYNFFDVYEGRKNLMYEDNRININYILLSLFLFFGFTGISSLKKEQKLFVYLSISAIIPALIWWIFLSKGWSRYAAPWFFTFSILAPFLIIFCSNLFVRGILTILLFLNLNIGSPDFIPIANLIQNKFALNERAKNLEDLVRFLSSQDKNKILVSTGAWNTYVEIEYALPNVNNFYMFSQIKEGVDSNNVLLVRHVEYAKLVKSLEYEKFEQIFSDTVFYKHPYLVTTYSGAALEESARK